MAVLKPAHVYIYTFQDQDTVIILGTTHGLGTAWVGCEVWDDGFPIRHRIEEGALEVDVPTHDITLTFATPRSGSVFVWG